MNVSSIGTNPVLLQNVPSLHNVPNVSFSQVHQTVGIRTYSMMQASKGTSMKDLIKRIAELELLLALLAIFLKGKDKAREMFSSSLSMMLVAGLASTIQQNMQFFQNQIQTTRVSMQQDLLSGVNVNTDQLNRNLNALDKVFADTVNAMAGAEGGVTAIGGDMGGAVDGGMAGASGVAAIGGNIGGAFGGGMAGAGGVAAGSFVNTQA